MIMSILTRKTRIADREVWEATLGAVLPKILQVLEREDGFAGVEYSWDINDNGVIVQVTRWQTEDDCRRYVREGGAATVATIEEAAIPTAPYPDGAWTRRTAAAAQS